MEKIKDLDTIYKERRIKYGTYETYEDVMATKENLTKIVDKINDIIDFINKYKSL